MQPTRQKFTEYLSSYQFKLNDSDEEVSYKLQRAIRLYGIDRLSKKSY